MKLPIKDDYTRINRRNINKDVNLVIILANIQYLFLYDENHFLFFIEHWLWLVKYKSLFVYYLSNNMQLAKYSQWIYLRWTDAS